MSVMMNRISLGQHRGTILFVGLLCLIGAVLLNGCEKSSGHIVQDVNTSAQAFYSLDQQFKCLPQKAAFLAAHRGVSKGEGLAENSQSALMALIERHILVAEIDVAGLRDGTHILFHDGIWDDKSTGRGPVASTDWDAAQTYLLKDTDGRLTSDRPFRLSDALALAKDKIYLEIDFKSSAKYERVIRAVREADMADQVVLIAYTHAQAKKLGRLAPDMLLSVSVNDKGGVNELVSAGLAKDQLLGWVGRDHQSSRLDFLKANKIPILAWPEKPHYKSMADPAVLLVTDYAFRSPPIIGLSKDLESVYKNCLETDN